MADEKYKKDLVEQAIMKDALSLEFNVKTPPDARYKKTNASKINDLPDLVVGKRIIIRVTNQKRDVIGYLLAAVLDYHVNLSYWDTQTTIINYVERCTNESLKHYLGRLISCKWESDGYWMRGSFQAVSFNKQDYKWL